MADGPHESGFTLIEMLAALMILAFGVTAVLGGFGSAIRTEQTSELVRGASLLVETVREELVNEDRLGKATDALPQGGTNLVHPDYPYLRYDLEYTADGETHEQMIAIVKVKWMRGGEEIAERYSFRVPRERPLWARISEELDQ